MPKFDLKSIHTNALFNLVKTKPSEEVESFVHRHKIDINVINQKLNMSVLSAINMGMSEKKTFVKSKENALFVIQRLENPFYRNQNNNIDIIETFILNQKSISTNKYDNLDEIVIKRIYDHYKDKDVAVFQKELCHTMKNMIQSDNSKNESTIESNIICFFSRANKFEEIMKSLINTKALKVMEDENFFVSIDDDYAELFDFKYAYSELSELILLFLKKYNNPAIADFVFTFFNSKGKIKDKLIPDFFEIMIRAGAKGNNGKRENKFINILSKLDHIKYPFIKKDIEDKTNGEMTLIASSSPFLYSAILEYSIKSKFHIDSKRTPAKAPQRSRL